MTGRINPDAAALVRELRRDLPARRVAELTGFTRMQVAAICRRAPRRIEPTRMCIVCCDFFPRSEMNGRKCTVCAAAPYLTPRHTPDDRDRWPFNPDATGFGAFLRHRRTA